MLLNHYLFILKIFVILIKNGSFLNILSSLINKIRILLEYSPTFELLCMG